MSTRAKTAMELINIAQNLIFSSFQKTQHYNNDRKTRDDFIKEVIGFGNEIYRGFTSNKDRPWLQEVHRLYDTGIIVIVNPYRGMDKIVTTKIARPGQIRAIYELPEFVRLDGKRPILKSTKSSPPASVMKKAIYYSKQGWNNDTNIPPRSEWEQIKNDLKRV